MRKKIFFIGSVFFLNFLHLEAQQQLENMQKFRYRYNNEYKYDTCYTFHYDSFKSNCTYIDMEIRKYNSKGLHESSEVFGSPANQSSNWLLKKRTRINYDLNDSLQSIITEALYSGKWFKTFLVENTYEGGKLKKMLYEPYGLSYDSANYVYNYDKNGVTSCKELSNWSGTTWIYEYEYNKGKLTSIIQKADSKILKEKDKVEARLSFAYNNNLVKEITYDHRETSVTEKVTFWDKLGAYHSYSDDRFTYQYYETPNTTRKTNYFWVPISMVQYDYNNNGQKIMEKVYETQKEYYNNYQSFIPVYLMRTTEYYYDTKNRITECVVKYARLYNPEDIITGEAQLKIIEKKIFGYAK